MDQVRGRVELDLSIELALPGVVRLTVILASATEVELPLSKVQIRCEGPHRLLTPKTQPALRLQSKHRL